MTSLFTCVAVLQQLPGAYLRALKPKKRAVKVQDSEQKSPVFYCFLLVFSLFFSYFSWVSKPLEPQKLQERSFSLEVQQELQCRKCLSALQRRLLHMGSIGFRWL